jgi:hypothetical protein
MMNSMNVRDGSIIQRVHAPVALLLYKFPPGLYLSLTLWQPLWHKVMHAISLDDNFIDSMMEKYEHNA